MLNVGDTKTLIFVLKGLEKICYFLNGVKELEIYNIFDKFHEFGNMTLLQSLRQHPNEEIRQKANSIVQIL